jgi:hypothetical protein
MSDSIWLSQIRGFSHEPIAARLIAELTEAFSASKLASCCPATERDVFRVTHASCAPNGLANEV